MVAQLVNHIGDFGSVIQVVCEGDAVALNHFADLMLAVAVEGGPLEDRHLLWRVPVVLYPSSGMSHNQLTAFVRARQADDQRAELKLVAGSVDVGLEKARWPLVDLRSWVISWPASSEQ